MRPKSQVRQMLEHLLFVDGISKCWNNMWN